MQRFIWLMVITILALGATLSIAGVAQAHQPYCETEDLTFVEPMVIEDPTISKALYATLDTPEDVDYIQFEGRAGDDVLLGLTIPRVKGQAFFAPAFALLGNDLPSSVDDLPARIETGNFASMFTVERLTGEASSFFEPFSRTSYWERQEGTITLPVDGTYMIAVWHPEGEIGRYVMIVGEREVFGGDLRCVIEGDFFTPVPNMSDLHTGNIFQRINAFLNEGL